MLVVHEILFWHSLSAYPASSQLHFSVAYEGHLIEASCIVTLVAAFSLLRKEAIFKKLLDNGLISRSDLLLFR